MNSTDLTNSSDLAVEDDPIFQRDAIFWVTTLSLLLGCLVEIILVIFFCSDIFLTRKKSDLKSAYFFISIIGYVVDIISSGSAAINQLIDPANLTTYSIISKFTVLYSDIHLGLLSTLMGLNRCTALAFPFAHNKVRSNVIAIFIIKF